MAENYSEFLNIKLDFLRKQTGLLHETVDGYVSEVSSACQTWLKVGGDKQMSFDEINTRLEHCIKYVTQKVGEVSKETSGGRGLTLPETPTETETPVETKQSSSASSSQASTSTSRPQPAVTGHDSDYSTKFLARLETIEMALASVHSVTEKISENQTKMETQIQEMAQKQSEMEKVQTKHLTDTEKQLKKANKRSEGMKQQEKKVASLEKDMEAMKQQDKRLSTLETQIQGMKKQEKRLGSVEKEMEAMSAKQSDLEKRTFVKISNVEKQIETNIDLTYHVRARIESVSNKTEAHDSSIQELASKLQVTDTTVQDLSAKVVENKSLIDDVSLKTRNLTKKINKYQKRTEDKLKEVKDGYHMVCAMVANRLLPLERLRGILNQRVKESSENIKKLEDVCDTATSLQKEVSHLENKMSTGVGFTAYLDEITPVPDTCTVINSFTDIRCNLGNHFDPSTGTFTAPVAGMYVVSVTLRQLNEGDTQVSVKQKPSNSRPDDSKVMCYTRTSKDETSSSGFSVVNMAGGNTLHVEVDWKEGQYPVTLTLDTYLYLNAKVSQKTDPVSEAWTKVCQHIPAFENSLLIIADLQEISWPSCRLMRQKLIPFEKGFIMRYFEATTKCEYLRIPHRQDAHARSPTMKI